MNYIDMPLAVYVATPGEGFGLRHFVHSTVTGEAELLDRIKWTYVVFGIITGLMFLDNLFGDAMQIIFFASINIIVPIPLSIAMFFDLDVEFEMFFAVAIMMTIKAFVLGFWNLGAELVAEGGWPAVVKFLNMVLPAAMV